MRNLGQRLGALVIIPAAGALVTLVLVYGLLTSTRDEARIVDLAGQQRLLAQRLLVPLDQYARHGDGAAGGELQRAMAEFENGLRRLVVGQGRSGQSPQPAPRAAQPQLAELHELWSEYAAVARSLLDSPPASAGARRAYDYLRAHNQALVAAADAVVQALEEHSVTVRGRLQVTLAGVAVLAVAAMVMGGYAIGRQGVERRRAEHEAAEREANLRALAENAHDGILVNSGGRHVFVNPRLARMLGYERDELLETGIDDIVHPSRRDATRRYYRQRLRGELAPSQYETFYLTKDGRPIPVEVTAAKTTWEGRPAALVISRDISERKRTEKALRDSEQRFRNLVETTTDCVWEVDANGVYTYVSPRVETLLGFARGDLLGKTPFDFMPAEEASPARERFQVAAAEKAPLDCLVSTHLTKDGGEVVLETSGVPVLDDMGRLRGYRGIDRDVTERRRMEDTLRESEAHLRQIIDLVPHMIFAKDREGRFLLANKTVADHYGTTVNELMRVRHGDVHGDAAELAHMLADDREVIATGKPKFIPQETVSSAEGETRIVQTTKIPYQVPGRDEPAVLGVAIDITEHKRMESQLREREILFRELAENVREVFFIRDLAQTRMVYVSPAYEEIWGRPVQALYDDPGDFVTSVHPEDRDRVIAAMEAQKSGCFFDEEYRIVRPDHALRWIRARTFPVYDDSGDLYRIAGIAEDITERKQAEQDLRESEARYRAIMEGASDAVFLAQPDGTLVDANRRASELFGYTRAEFNGMHAARLHPPEERPKLEAALRDINQRGTSLYEHKIVRKDGTVAEVEVAGALVRYGDNRLVLGVFRDLTERRQAEQERLQREKVQRDTLVREVHHRIKNHLQGLVGLLNQDAGDHPAIRDQLAKVAGQIRSVAVVHGLQGAAGHGELRLCDMVEAICRSAQSITGKAIQPALERRTLRPVHVHSEEAVSVALIVNELVTNALKHTCGDDPPCRVCVAPAKQAGRAEVLVQNPCDMDDTQLQHALGAGSGTGIQLARALLPREGATLEIRVRGGSVEARLNLSDPVLAGEAPDVQTDGATQAVH